MKRLGWIGFGLVACQGAGPVGPLDATPTTSVEIAAPLAPSPSAASPVGSSSSAARLPALRYLALGDSFTIGTGSAESDAFPAVFARTSGCEVTLLNVAKNGYTTDDVLRRELPALAEFRPDFVTLGIGANDRVRGAPLAAYERNVERILDAVLAAGVAPERVFLVPQPDWSRSPAARDFGEPAELSRSITDMNAALRRAGAKRGLRWLEIDGLLADQARRGMLAPDRLHPSREAHAAWAAALVRAACPADTATR